MEDGSTFEVGTENWAPTHGPNSTVKTSYFWRRPQLLRAGYRRAKNSILICHFWFGERWAKSAQLFTFLLSFNENKFQFSS